MIKWRSMMTLAGMGGIMLAIAGCERESSAPPAAKPPHIYAGAGATLPAEPKHGIPPELEEVGNPGRAIARKFADGQVWNQFPNGMAYQTGRPGKGLEAQLGQVVTLVWVGRYLTGEEFGSARKDAPLKFALGDKRVIKPLMMVVKQMAPGAQLRIWVPTDLLRDKSRTIGQPPKLAGEAVIYELELLKAEGESIQPPEKKEIEPLGPPPPPGLSTQQARAGE